MRVKHVRCFWHIVAMPIMLVKTMVTVVARLMIMVVVMIMMLG